MGEREWILIAIADKNYIVCASTLPRRDSFCNVNNEYFPSTQSSKRSSKSFVKKKLFYINVFVNFHIEEKKNCHARFRKLNGRSKFFFASGSDGISVDRRDYDSTARGGLDTSSGQTCGCLLPDQRRPLDLMGGRNEGKMSQRAWHFDCLARRPFYPFALVINMNVFVMLWDSFFKNTWSASYKTILSLMQKNK